MVLYLHGVGGGQEVGNIKKKKSRIREAKHLSTDANSSTNAIGELTKNTPKPDFFEKQKISFKLKNV